MLKYENKGNTIEINLPKECGHNGYAVECTYYYDKQKNQYQLRIGLKRNDIGDIQEIDTQYISNLHGDTRRNITKMIEDASLSGYFEKYIERYEYTYKCFDRGNELFELERNGKLLYPAIKEKVICMTIYQCPNCGNYLEEHSNHCPRCRVLLDWEIVHNDTSFSDGRCQ